MMSENLIPIIFILVVVSLFSFGIFLSLKHPCKAYSQKTQLKTSSMIIGKQVIPVTTVSRKCSQYE